MSKTTLVCAAVLFFSFLNIDVKAQLQPNAPLKVNLPEQNTMAVLWFQRSGEAKALYYQGYNIGKMRLDEALMKKKHGLKPAVVLDIDETILDNSPYQAWSVLTGKPYVWNEWFEKGIDQPLPGALDFLKYANEKNVEIFYISNRHEAQTEATIQNLKMVGAPQANGKHVLLKKPGEKGKDRRRFEVAEKYDIVLFFGDNLSDFSGFENLSVSGRIQATERRKEEFGKKFIVFPNPMYGDWESAIYHYQNNRPDVEKAKLRKESLEEKHP